MEAPAFCENHITILTPYKLGIKAARLACKRWSCDWCFPKNCHRLKKKAKKGSPNTFITLTVNPKWGWDPDQRARGLVEAWRRVRRKAEHHWGNRKIPFIAVFEQTEEGEPHLHILARSNWIPQSWLSDQMNAEMQAPIVDIRRVRSQRSASAYVSKYVGKNPERFPGTKRFWTSLDYLVKEEKPKVEDPDQTGKSYVMLMPIDEVVSEYKRTGWRHTRFKEAWFHEDWFELIPLKLREEPEEDVQTALF